MYQLSAPFHSNLLISDKGLEAHKTIHTHITEDQSTAAPLGGAQHVAAA